MYHFAGSSVLAVHLRGVRRIHLTSDIRGLSASESFSAHSRGSNQAKNLHLGTIRWPGVLNYQTNGKLLPGADSSFVYHSSQNMND